MSWHSSVAQRENDTFPDMPALFLRRQHCSKILLPFSVSKHANTTSHQETVNISSNLVSYNALSVENQVLLACVYFFYIDKRFSSKCTDISSNWWRIVPEQRDGLVCNKQRLKCLFKRGFEVKRMHKMLICAHITCTDYCWIQASVHTVDNRFTLCMFTIALWAWRTKMTLEMLD